MVQWLEEQGYNVTYTDDVQLATNPESLLDHKVDLISGHSEYWSYAAFHNMIAAREHGVSIASFSSNTAYWQTRFENNYRTLVCYKTMQGCQRRRGDPQRPRLDRPARGNSCRSSRPPPAATRAPPRARRAPHRKGGSGVNEPENELFGSMYVGDNEAEDWGLTRSRHQRQRRIRGQPRVAQRRHPEQLGGDHRQRHRRLGVGPDPERRKPGVRARRRSRARRRQAPVG